MKGSVVVRKGFTLIEVLLFLAITGLMIVGLLTGIGVRVATQRYNDAVQDIDDFLTRIYSEVVNVENSRDDVAFNQTYCNGYLQELAARNGKPVLGNENAVIDAAESAPIHAGRSRCAIYGKLVTFGESNGKINLYTVIGRLVTSDIGDNTDDLAAGSSTLAALKTVGADVYAYKYIAPSCTVASAGVFESHNLIWDASIQNTNNKDTFKGAALIVRSPISGTVHTYRLKAGKNFNLEQLFSGSDLFACSATTLQAKTNQISSSPYFGSLKVHLDAGDFEEADLDFCVDSPDLFAAGGKRRNIRILKDGRNASAVKLVDSDSGEDDYRCGL